MAVSLIIAIGMPGAATAAGPPQIGAIWVTGVSSSSVTFDGEINPNGSSTRYQVEYVTDQVFQEKEFSGAAKFPPGEGKSAGTGSAFVTVLPLHVTALRSATLYHYRFSAINSFGPAASQPQGTFTTQEIGGAFGLPDGRGWEMVSPVDKNGGAIQGPEENHGGGVLQAAAAGPGEITYSSASSFGGFGAPGAPPASQYISRHEAGGWSTENITTPTVSGSYGNEPNGVPYQLFSPDLLRGLLLNGIHCRGEGMDCPIANPPLPGTSAPEGYQNYYLRDDEDGNFSALMTEANSELALAPEEFNLAFAGASPDLRHVVLSSCAALTPEATEVAGTEGCDPGAQNLYEYANGQLKLVNTKPGAALAAQAGAVSVDGSRVYYEEEGLTEEALYLREGSGPQQKLAEGAEFQTATPSGAFAFYLKEGRLFRYDAAANSSTALTPSGSVVGVLGASESGSRVYYATSGGIFLYDGGATTPVATGPAAAPAADYPPATGTARVSDDGTRLLFVSDEPLTGYDNTDAVTGDPDSEVFLFDISGGGLICISCNPTGERPTGPSTIPGAYANGEAPGSTDSYKPRALSSGKDRAFFDSDDSLTALDSNGGSDVYQWESQGTGTCSRPGGCLGLISNGRDSVGASFVDASESGDDVYLRTFFSLAEAKDPGSADIYDARVGGGETTPDKPITCRGDACVPLPIGPEDPTVGSLIPGRENEPVHFPQTHHCPKGKRTAIRRGKMRCVKRHVRQHHSDRKRGLR